jgi:hypothetical protein
MKIKMQHIFVHGDLQIFKNLNIFTLDLYDLNILCRNLQSINQLNIDKIMQETRVNINNDIFFMNTSMNLQDRGSYAKKTLGFLFFFTLGMIKIF